MTKAYRPASDVRDRSVKVSNGGSGSLTVSVQKPFAAASPGESAISRTPLPPRHTCHSWPLSPGGPIINGSAGGGQAGVMRPRRRRMHCGSEPRCLLRGRRTIGMMDTGQLLLT
eukprot:747282-Hanusia_phi.AAC.2